jgi:hypothetical protein
VDLHVARGVGLGVVGARGRLALHDLPKPLDRLVLGLVGRQAGQRDLEQQARLEQLVERHGAGLEHHRDRVAEAAAHALLGGSGDEDAAARPLGGADQVAAGEQPERLAQGRPADTELGRQILLAPEEVVRTQPLLLDVVLDLDGHLLAGGTDRSPGRAPRSGPAARPDAHEGLGAARITARSATGRP